MSSAFGDSLCLEMSARLFLTTCNWFMFIFVLAWRAIKKKSVSRKVQSFLDFARELRFPFHGFEPEWT